MAVSTCCASTLNAPAIEYGGAAPAPSPDPRHADLGDYDDPQFQAQFIARPTDDEHEAVFVVEGMTCPACAHTIEGAIGALGGVVRVDVEFGAARARVRWRPAALALSDLLAAFARLGYDAAPYQPSRDAQAIDRARKRLLRQFAVALAFGMQVMMIAAALYFEPDGRVEAPFDALFRWMMLALTIPVVGYSAQAFYGPAIRALRARTLAMDVPVSAGIVLAFVASVQATVSGSGPLYYDSVTMFVTLLLAARVFEIGARRRAARAVENLRRLTPQYALRLGAGATDRPERISVARLAPGDRVLIRPGEHVPADANIETGVSSVDEALLTGESAPVGKRPGDDVIAGSVNGDGVLIARVTATGAATRYGRILALLDRAASARPRWTRLADAAAARFVAVVLVLAAGVAAIHWTAGNPQWVAITIAVLVVSCPCALSLATPAVLSAAVNRALAAGVLVVRADALEGLAGVTDAVFDKTGTLTDGRLEVAEVATHAALSRLQCLDIAAALEVYSTHPIATAIRRAAGAPVSGAADVRATIGAGVSGRVADRVWHLGSRAYIRRQSGDAAMLGPDPGFDCGAGCDTRVHLADPDRVVATLQLRDKMRAAAPAVVNALRARGIAVHLMSGDGAAPVGVLARSLGIVAGRADLDPAGKLEAVRALQQAGRRVAMIGDGVNDAPVLAGADVAVAIGRGADIARTQADLVLLRDDVGVLPGVFALARQARRIIRQNLAWALLYNLACVPAAAFGYMPPWVAALGMALSSTLVLSNALRLAPVAVVDAGPAPVPVSDRGSAAPAVV